MKYWRHKVPHKQTLCFRPKRALSICVLAGLISSTAVASPAWSPDHGPSLFKTLGIALPTIAKSQILQTNTLNLSALSALKPPQNSQRPAKAQPRADAALSVLPNNPLPASPLPAASPSVLPPSTEPSLAAGTSSASSPAIFVPQNATPKSIRSDEADPVIMAQKVLMAQKAAPAPKIAKPQAAPKAKTAPKTKTATDGWAHILQAYARPDATGLVRFNYAALSANPADLHKLAGFIAAQSQKQPSKMSRDQAMVYWANLYNALTVQIVAENWPVSSIRKIKSGLRAGPWKRKLISVEGRTLSLDDIEHGIMRPTFKTPLVHYMVNCASIGCPNLQPTPWRVASLRQDQERAARAYINSPRGVNLAHGRVQVSSIYKWFKEDFGGNEAGVLAHLQHYADAPLRAKLVKVKKIDKYAYDWAVNAP